MASFFTKNPQKPKFQIYIWPVVLLKQKFSLSVCLSSTETEERAQLHFVLRNSETKGLSALGWNSYFSKKATQ